MEGVSNKFLSRTDGRVGYALEDNTDYTIISDFACGYYGDPFRRVYMALYRGRPIHEIQVSQSLSSVMSEIVDYSRCACIA
ncbi:MAG: hypothetical protein PHI98_01310 [Eubacteriales bacterium]|nr:hypothetical protein [Eubacteriales bacterium]